MTAAEHRVESVESRPGELVFEARIGGHSSRVWMRTEDELATSAEAVLPACLMPAMRFGGTLELPVPISPRVLRNQREYQGIQSAWSRGWEWGDPPLREVEVEAAAAEVEPTPANGRVAAFFSGGVDSWFTVLDNPDITDLVFVRGIDLLVDAPHQAPLAGTVEDRLRGVAEELGLGFHAVETNLRQLTDPLTRWEAFFASAMSAVALFLAPRFDRILVAGAFDYEVQPPIGGDRLVENLWSSESLEVFEAAGRHSRMERIARVAEEPLAQRTLRVCWENPGGAYNCGRCIKCLGTMFKFEAVGGLDAIETFPSDLDLEAVAAIEVTQDVSLLLWEDALDVIRENGRADLEPIAERVIETGRGIYGLPPTYRRRALPGPPPLNPGGTASTPTPHAGDAALRDAEARELLDSLLTSRSWRLTAPLRRLGALRLAAAARASRGRR